MKKLNTALATVVAIAAAAPLSAQSYRADVTMKQEVDLTAMGVGMQVSDVSATSFVTLSMRDSTEGKIATFTVDSVQVTSTGPNGAMFSQELADSLPGATLVAHVVDGKVKGAPKPSVENPVMTLVIPVANTLFPGIPGDAGSRGSWSDTTTSNNMTETGTTNSQQYTNWTVTGQDGNVLKLSATSTGTVSAEQPGVQEASGTIESTLTMVSVAGGPATSVDAATAQVLTLIVPQAPDPIPVKVNTTAKIAVLP